MVWPLLPVFQPFIGPWALMHVPSRFQTDRAGDSNHGHHVESSVPLLFLFCFKESLYLIVFLIIVNIFYRAHVITIERGRERERGSKRPDPGLKMQSAMWEPHHATCWPQIQLLSSGTLSLHHRTGPSFVLAAPPSSALILCIYW